MQADGAKVSLVLDNKMQMEIIAKNLEQIDREEDLRLKEAKQEIPVRKPINIVIEIDMSLNLIGNKLGVLRSPIFTEQELRNFLRDSKNFPSLKVIGAMGYEAIVAGLQDSTPAPWYDIVNKTLNFIKSWIRKTAVPDIATRRAKLPEIFKSEGFIP